MCRAIQCSAVRNEQVAESVIRFVQDRTVRQVVVLTHYGSLPLDIVEVWECAGVLYLSVLADQPPSK